MSRNRTAFEKQTFKLIDELERTAQNYGWSRDQGGRLEAEQDKKAFEEAKAALVKRIHALHSERRKVARLKNALLDERGY